jgi:hypothetical protein
MASEIPMEDIMLVINNKSFVIFTKQINIYNHILCSLKEMGFGD